MWIWVVIIAVIVGAVFGMLSGDGNSKENAAGGALAGGCLAIGCLARIAFAALIILGILWLASLLFG